ncbi:substrate-binding domain-containing protein [Streptomyces sp. NPDC002187]|uniref:substrate-binding domain-containing protein n=1 Tax=Streptomyces sp. NPDC002187 TaxID=3364637 RepID=UPI0036BBBEBB
MGRQSLPDDGATDSGRSRRPHARRRSVALATMLVLAVAAGTGGAAQTGLLSFTGSCEDTAVELDLVASPDIAPAVREIADRAREDRVTSDGQCMDVHVSARENHQVAQEMATGGNDRGYEVWLPDSAIWAERAQGTGGGVPLTAAGNVAASPVALATLPPAGSRLGWPARTYTWAQLTASATATDDFRLGAADPARSATGLLALTSVARSAEAAGSKGDTTVAATARLLSRRVSATDARAARTLAGADSGVSAGDPTRNQAVFLSEQAAFAFNSDADVAAPKLALFYPTDVAPLLDYPYHLVDESRLSTDESRAATRFMALLAEPESRRTLDRSGFRAADATAGPRVVGTAGGRPPQRYAAAGRSEPLSPDALEETLGMWTITVQSARLTAVVDITGSMQTPVPGSGGRTRLDVTEASLRRTMDRFSPDDELGLSEFATGLDGGQDFRELVPTRPLGPAGKGGGAQRARLTKAFDELKTVPNGATGLYDTTLAVYEKARAGYVPGKLNALVLITDGTNDDRFSISRSALISGLKKLGDPRHPLPVIAIAVGTETDLEEIEQIAEATGGAGHQVADPSEIQGVILEAIVEIGRRAPADQD